MSPPIYRYVDDILLFTKNIEEGEILHAGFNNNNYGLKFTIEKPDVYNSISFLDFRIEITEEGEAIFNFYRKPSRKNNFINSETALPENTINNVIQQEWQRIQHRCSKPSDLNKHYNEFKNRLAINGHKNKVHYNNRTRAIRNQDQKFFLNIPFLSNTLEYKIRKALRDLNLNIVISHKSTQLKQLLSVKRNNDTCHLTGCKLKNDLCLVRGTVYHIKCNLCGDNYIGSSWRYLHLRYKEHSTQKSSPIYHHNNRCGGSLVVEVLQKENNIQRLRIKEAILIKQLKPSMNGKDDLFKTHILFE
jgi:hypothetical protein